MKSLKKLVLSKNKIDNLSGLAKIPNLEHLVLIENQLADVK
jgi:Leucine-rich repeat (LRR) protein